MGNNLVLIQASKILKGGNLKPGVSEAIRAMEEYASVIIVDVSDEQASDLAFRFSTIRTSADAFLEDLKHDSETRNLNVVVIGSTRYDTNALVVSSIDWERFSARHELWLNALSGQCQERKVAV